MTFVLLLHFNSFTEMYFAVDIVEKSDCDIVPARWIKGLPLAKICNAGGLLLCPHFQEQPFIIYYSDDLDAEPVFKPNLTPSEEGEQSGRVYEGFLIKCFSKSYLFVVFPNGSNFNVKFS